MPKNIITDAPVDDEKDGGSFATMPKDISHVTFYFDLTPDDLEDDEFSFVKVETPDAVSDDLDAWYEDALAEILARNPELADGELVGAAIKFGSGKSGSGGEFYYDLDGDSTDFDSAPTGGLVQAREYAGYGGGAEYQYGDLF
ncbi:MAG: hypothetical protein A2790_15925 [Phenylobacterium sp. RIFCSPHIGHO2_01_FULL_69_31]|uniref:hypothetical protein n=1 Tax=Phenylobacterium sp. RIFCSPHIGHO2_01_FULL_69_31 TaxID=1801944 RepID=UPI0008B311B1|nr:hypothetical protein [Phenylobacterium sp. RIFCSPHIGHO2_01_FULL_69_31]OHB28495.1 MAG: hypothetical protein A2790_15925 [Phenylobacterium sp. RIFCSPHIGHO2_01_FULL_69_31]